MVNVEYQMDEVFLHNQQQTYVQLEQYLGQIHQPQMVYIIGLVKDKMDELIQVVLQIELLHILGNDELGELVQFLVDDELKQGLWYV